MRILLLVLILILSLQSLTKADNIRDFEIEGISIGDSLLSYSTKQEVHNNMITDYNSKKYSRYTLRKINSEPLVQYDDIQVHFKTNDKDLIITSISGAATSISNVGPGLGSTIGPNGDFSSLPDVSKWILSMGMILGRLELFAILVLFLPSFWRN